MTTTYSRPFGYYFDLMRSLVNRDLKLMYKRSTLGIAWALVNPLLQLAVFSLVFQVVLPIQVPRYASSVFTGLLVWSWFMNSLTAATGTIISNRPLIRQPGFPAGVLPLVTMTTGLIHFLLALPILIVFLLWDKVPLQPVILLLPLLQALQFTFTASLSYVLAALNVTFRDTQHSLGVFLQLFFYVTPVFYDANSIPPQYQFIYTFNPIAHLITAYRAIFLQGVWPDFFALGAITLITAVLLPIGYQVFQRQSAGFVEEI